MNVLMVPCRKVCKVEKDACPYWSCTRLSLDCRRSNQTPKFSRCLPCVM